MIKKLMAVILLAGCLVATATPASEGLWLRFHMVLAGGGKAFVGGTLQNIGRNSIAHGYMVATFFDENCFPKGSVMYEFSDMKPGKLGFQVSAPAGFKYYSVSHLAAFDYLGRPIPAKDEHETQVSARISKMIADCDSGIAAQ